MLNHMDNPAEMLAWLSQRNHHIPLEDLAFMMASTVPTEDLDGCEPLGFEDDFTHLDY